MKTLDFNKKLTSRQLAENLDKQFNVRTDLTKYDREQLEDIRNKLRTKVFQQENESKFNELLTNETYQKDKAMLELLNTRIKEMLGEDMKKLRDKIDALNESKKSVKAKETKDQDADEGNAFSGALANAKKDHKDSFKVGGKEFKVKEAKGKKCDECGMTMEACGCDHKKKDKKVKEARLSEKSVSKKQQRFMGMVYAAKKGEKPASPEVAKAAKGMSKKDAKDFAKTKHKGLPEKKKKKNEDYKTKSGIKVLGQHSNKTFKPGDKKEPGTFGKLAKKVGKDLNPLNIHKVTHESKLRFKQNVRLVNESIQVLLREDEEEKAKAITSAGDMVNDYTSWMQRVGTFQTKAMIELTDTIRANFGQQEMEAFKTAVAPALATTLEILTQQREVIANAVATLAGESVAPAPMGPEPTPDLGPEVGKGEPDLMNEPPAGEDEFAASDAAAGAGTAGREMRESKAERKARRLAEAHSLMAKLAK